MSDQIINKDKEVYDKVITVELPNGFGLSIYNDYSLELRLHGKVIVKPMVDWLALGWKNE